MNSTPWSASTAQNRSSGLCSGVSTNLLDPEGGPPRALRAARTLGGRDPQIRADERQVHAALVVLTGRPEQLTRRRTRHRLHSIRAALPGGYQEPVGLSRGATAPPGRPERWGVWGAISGPPISYVV